jgi:hypothetical protein
VYDQIDQYVRLQSARTPLKGAGTQSLPEVEDSAHGTCERQCGSEYLSRYPAQLGGRARIFRGLPLKTLLGDQKQKPTIFLHIGSKEL